MLNTDSFIFKNIDDKFWGWHVSPTQSEEISLYERMPYIHESPANNVDVFGLKL